MCLCWFRGFHNRTYYQLNHDAQYLRLAMIWVWFKHDPNLSDHLPSCWFPYVCWETSSLSFGGFWPAGSGPFFWNLDTKGLYWSALNTSFFMESTHVGHVSYVDIVQKPVDGPMAPFFSVSKTIQTHNTAVMWDRKNPLILGFSLHVFLQPKFKKHQPCIVGKSMWKQTKPFTIVHRHLAPKQHIKTYTYIYIIHIYIYYYILLYYIIYQ